MTSVADSMVDLTFHPAPASETPRGAVIVCPGGGYQGLAAHEAEPVADWLNRAGFPAFVLRYRVAPHRHPAPLEDSARAVRLVRHGAAGFGCRPDRIAVLGFSAGGHLVTTLATRFDRGDPNAADPVERHSSRPDAVVAGYAVISMQSFAHEGCRRNLIGEPPAPGMIEALSNERHVTAETPPAFLWSTADDPSVPVGHSLLFAQALADRGVPFELHVFPHGPHGLGLADHTSTRGACAEVAQWTELCQRWLARLGF